MSRAGRGPAKVRELVTKLVEYVNKFMRQAQQLGSLKHDVHSLGDALQEGRRENFSLVEELQAKFEENKFMTETFKEKGLEMKKV